MEDTIKKELRRQFVHASGAMLVPLAFIFGKFPVGAASLVLAFAIFILAEHKNENGKKINTDKSNILPIHSVFEKFERSGGNYRGAFYFYLASAVSLFLFPLPIAMISITVLALGDSFSTAVGIFGRNRIFYNRKKTWEGTLAGFAAAFAGCYLISPQLAFIAAFVGMAVESLPLKTDDNLTIPIMTGIALSVLSAI
ncbi:MAG: diacylglycerol/polyprenol kinase family protein [Candidatus Aenigmatarchaeota archaeon]